MDYEGENINHRDEMLSRFRESLSRPLTERYFEEDELLEIFDYAGDLGDDYLRIEALLCAARFFPDSQEFMERKAIFYNQFSDDSSSKYIDDNQDASGMIWDIMRARQAAPDDDKSKIAILESIVNAYDNFNDEEVIQFIDLVSYFRQMQWLKDNLPMLRKKVAFLNILLYEVAIAAAANQDVSTAAMMLEELTELEPFNFYFWLMLAKEYESMDMGDNALNAIDYALAINPDDPQSLLTKAKLLYVNSRPKDAVIEYLKKLLSIKPDMTEGVRMLASVYSEIGNDILAATVLNDYIQRYPQYGTSIIPDLIIYRPKNIAELLDRFYKANEDNSQFIWASWAHQLAQNGYADVSVDVLKAFERNSGMKIFALYAIEHLFVQQKYDEAVMALSEYLTNNDNREIDFPTIVIIHLISMVKLGEYEHAMEFCKFLEKNAIMSRYSDISSRLEFLGMIEIVRKIKRKLKKTQDPADWADLDPLEIWKQTE